MTIISIEISNRISLSQLYQYLRERSTHENLRKGTRFPNLSQLLVKMRWITMRFLSESPEVFIRSTKTIAKDRIQLNTHWECKAQEATVRPTCSMRSESSREHKVYHSQTDTEKTKVSKMTKIVHAAQIKKILKRNSLLLMRIKR